MIPLLKEIMAWQEKNLGPNNQGTLNCMNLLVHSFQLTKDLKNAIPLSEELHKQIADVPGPNGNYTQMVKMVLAKGYLMAGQPEKALPLIEKVRETTKEEDINVSAGAFLLAIGEKSGKPDAELRTLADELVAERQKLPKSNDEDDANRLSGHVQICLGAEAFKAAELLALEYATIQSRVLPADL